MVESMVGHLLAKHVSERGIQPAVSDDYGTLGWKDLADGAAIVRRQMEDIGTEPSDVVGVLCDNVAHFYFVRLALSLAEMVAFTIPAHLSQKEVARLLAQSGARWLFDVRDPNRASYSLDGMVGPGAVLDLDAISGVQDSSRRVSLYELPTNASQNTHPIEDRQVDLIMPTSGSTGSPKIYVRSDETFLFRARTLNTGAAIDTQTVLLACPPIGQGIGQLFGFACAIESGCHVVLSTSANPRRHLDAINAHSVTVLGGVPTHAFRVSDLVAGGASYQNTVETVVVGGAAADPSKMTLVEEELGCRCLNYYGMGELGIPSMPSLQDPAELRHQGIGPVVDGVNVAILLDDGSWAGAGEIGEICIKGAGVSDGYVGLGNTGGTALFDEEGWGHSGDLGFIDGRGRLHVVGRKKEVIIRGGLNVLPSELERQAIRSIDGISDAVAVGVPDEDLGERILLALIPVGDSPVAAEQIRDHLRASGLSRLKLPDEVAVLDELPTSGVGKVDKKRLSAAASDDTLREQSRSWWRRHHP